ncbi:unnamed protein product [Penicillium salamii]|nr:unnamed protein product [Penicillium salamii]
MAFTIFHLLAIIAVFSVHPCMLCGIILKGQYLSDPRDAGTSTKTETDQRPTKHKFTTQKGIFGALECDVDDVVVDDEEQSKDIYLPKVRAKPDAEPTLPSMPLVRRQVTRCGCGREGYIYSKYPSRAEQLIICPYCDFCSRQTSKVLLISALSLARP